MSETHCPYPVVPLLWIFRGGTQIIVFVHGSATQYDRGPYWYLREVGVLCGELLDYIFGPEAYALWIESAAHAA